jgi:flagellar basal-body rod protein FlgG
MLEGLYSAAAGMSAQQEQLNAISNDLANVSTSGYQAERVAFSDLLYSPLNMAGTATTTGAGAKAQLIGRSETQGSLQETGQPLDLAIEGAGYFQVTRANGKVALTRDGTFGVDARGQIVNAEGNRLSPPIKLPAGVSPNEVSISPDGTVAARGHKLGQIELVTVTSPGHMLADGSGELTPTAASGAPHAAKGRIHQGAVEASNVNIASEMALMVSTQRDFQLTSTAIQTESQMMSIANQLRSP